MLFQVDGFFHLKLRAMRARVEAMPAGSLRLF